MVKFEAKTPKGLDKLFLKIDQFKKDITHKDTTLKFRQRIDDDEVLEVDCNITTDLNAEESIPKDCNIKIIKEKVRMKPVDVPYNPFFSIEE